MHRNKFYCIGPCDVHVTEWTTFFAFLQYTKIFTVKLQYIFYKERAGIRPGQISKMQKLAGKVGFLAKAVEEADYEGVKEFASDMKKLGVPLEHAPQVNSVTLFHEILQILRNYLSVF